MHYTAYMSFQMAPQPRFSKDELIKIVEWWFELRDLDKVRWRYAKEKGIEKFPRKLPKKNVFKRVIDRFRTTGSVKIEYPKKKEKKPVIENEETVERVRQLITSNVGMSLRQMATELDLPKSTVWDILRKTLNFYPYKINLTTELTEQHKRARLEYNRWLLEQPEDFPEIVIWTDEKIFLLHSCPNKQNERYWFPKGDNPNIEEACRVQGGPKVMCWAMIIDGRVFVHWFDIGVRENTEVYIRDVLQGFMWPILLTMPRRARYWFQQDGARCHTSNLSLEWIREKFGTQVISGNTEIAWPARSPDEAPCDYFLWGICDQEIRRVKPRDLGELQEVVSDFVESLDEDVARRAVRDVRPRAQMCIKWAAAFRVQV